MRTRSYQTSYADLVARVMGFAQAAMLESTESPDERKAPRVQF